MKSELQSLIEDCNAEMNDIESKLTSLDAFDKTKLYLTKYALMKASGTLEFVFRSIVADFFDDCSSQVVTYIEKTVRTGSMSSTYDNMKSLLKKFDDAWASEFQSRVNSASDKQRIIDSAKSIVTNRHSFAHGREPTATFGEIKTYYTDALQLINILDLVVNPPDATS